jgi:hypothetical protein
MRMMMRRRRMRMMRMMMMRRRKVCPIYLAGQLGQHQCGLYDVLRPLSLLRHSSELCDPYWLTYK